MYGMHRFLCSICPCFIVAPSILFALLLKCYLLQSAWHIIHIMIIQRILSTHDQTIFRYTVCIFVSKSDKHSGFFCHLLINDCYYYYYHYYWENQCNLQPKANVSILHKQPCNITTVWWLITDYVRHRRQTNSDPWYVYW